MRHRVSGKKLNRSTKHRQALMKNLIRALILRGQIVTTKAKAKLIQRKTDKLITQAKKGTLHSRRLIHAYLNQKNITHRLVDTLAPNMTSRKSGYTRVVKLNQRRGDNAQLAKIEFVDPIPQLTPTPSEKTKKSTKSKTSPSATKKQTQKSQ